MEKMNVVKIEKKKMNLSKMANRIRDVAEKIDAGDEVTSCMIIYTMPDGEGSVHSYDWSSNNQCLRLIGAVSIALLGLQQELS